MLSKKRPILFDVLGHRTRHLRARTEEPERPVTPVRPAAPARRRKQPSSRPKASPGSEVLRTRVLWAGLALALLLAVGLAVWRLKQPGSGQSPALQSVREEQAEAGPDATHVYAVCAWTREYKNKTERRLAADKVHEIVNFLGYHSHPELRDVRGLDRPGKEPDSGTFRIYVGSANDRTSLLGLCKQVAGVTYKKDRPFQSARIVRVERDA